MIVWLTFGFNRKDKTGRQQTKLPTHTNSETEHSTSKAMKAITALWRQSSFEGVPD